MREIPMLMNDEMMLAVLDGMKTQTRRPIKPQPVGAYVGLAMQDMYQWVTPGRGITALRSTPCQFGDVLWLREAWQLVKRQGEGEDEWLIEWPKGKLLPGACLPGWELCYRADGCDEEGAHWRPSIHMPRWACRVTLSVLRVRVERVRDISETDAYAEGCPLDPKAPHPILWFRQTWDSIYAPGAGWDANPWVWVTEWMPYQRSDHSN